MANMQPTSTSPKAAQAPRKAKYPFYVARSNASVHPSQNNLPGYEDDHKDMYIGATSLEAAKKLAEELLHEAESEVEDIAHDIVDEVEAFTGQKHTVTTPDEPAPVAAEPAPVPAPAAVTTPNTSETPPAPPSAFPPLPPQG